MPSSDCKVYIGDLGSSASKHDIEDAFSPFGRLSNVWVARNPPGFAFVEFDDVRDAEDAVKEMDGRSICGRRVRVELSNGRMSRGGGAGGRRGGGRPRGAHPEDKCYQCGDRGHFARDCRMNSRNGGSGGGGGGGGGRRDYRSRSSSPRRRRSYSRSVSKDRSPRRSRSPRSRSPVSRSAGGGRSRSRS